MKLLDYYKPYTDKNVICLGRFDGLHLGHKTLIYKGLEIKNGYGYDTKLAVFMFQGSGAIGRLGLIYTFRESIERLKSEPVDNVIVAPETSDFFNIDKSEFLETIKNNFNPVAIICGEDYRFGHNREGDKEYLREFCLKNGIALCVIPLVKIHGEKVSSSKIKELISEGRVDEAYDFLGENYFIRGQVLKGRGVGRKLGFPTLNVMISPDKVPLKEGVYATFTSFNGEIHPSVTNYGCAPTFSDNTKLVETHVINSHCDLYGFDVKIDFKRYLRPNVKFDSVDELIEQLKKDVKSI